MSEPQREFHAENLFSLRVWFSAMIMGFVGTAIIVVPLYLIWEPLQWAGYGICPVLILVIVYNLCTGTPVYCPDCRKRIKLQATTCHHCGWQAPAEQPS